MPIKRPTNSAAFPSVLDLPYFPYVDPMPDWGGPLPVDNPDGVVKAYGLGTYESADGEGREFSQGAGTVKGNVGNASGRSKKMRVKGEG